MSIRTPHLSPLAASLALTLTTASAFAAKPGPDSPLDIQLIAEHTELVPGQSQQLALLLRHRPQWHTAWINPGDSGVPTQVEWTLPATYTIDDIAWPTPRRFEVGGHDTFGYDGEILLPVSITLPATAAVGSTAHIALVASWQVCRDECVPGKASLAIDLPVVHADAKPDPRWTAQFSEARLEQPQATAWKGTITDEGDRFQVILSGPGLPPATAQLDAVSVQQKLFDNKPPTIHRDGDSLVMQAGKSSAFTTLPSELDLLVTTRGAEGARSWHVRIPSAAEPPPRTQ